MEENRYSKSKVYKLQCDDGYYYIGSTTAPLSKRLGGHKKDSIKNPHQKKFQHINTIGWDKVKIVLVSEHCLENKEQLLREEDKYIRECKDDPFCLNTRLACCTEEERENYYAANKERLQIAHKEYYEKNKEACLDWCKKYYSENNERIKERVHNYAKNNKDKIKERNARPYTCECGITLTIQHKLRHEKSKKHIDYVNTLSSNNALSDDADLPCISPRAAIECCPHISLEKC